jgi:hypothetical protein
MTLSLAFFAAVVTMDVCSAATAPKSMDDKEFRIVGQLIFSRHSAHLLELGRAADDSKGCAVFTIFPGTPAFLIPGITIQDTGRDEKWARFVPEYKSYADAHPMRPKQFAVKGKAKN